MLCAVQTATLYECAFAPEGAAVYVVLESNLLGACQPKF